MFGEHYQNGVLGFMFALLVGMLSYSIWIILFPLSFVVVLIVSIVVRKRDFAVGAVVGVLDSLIFSFFFFLSLASLLP